MDSKDENIAKGEIKVSVDPLVFPPYTPAADFALPVSMPETAHLLWPPVSLRKKKLFIQKAE